MGRFYQTAKPEFVNDFIYQPPWELMQQALTQEQNNYDVSLAKADLFKDLNINYIEDPIEKQRVAEKQNYYATRADELTNSLKNAGNDWKKILPQLNDLKKELSTDYKTGDIHNFETSAANYKAMEEQLKLIKDPARKEAARQDFLKTWGAGDPNRDKSNIFNSRQVYDKQDPTGEFLTEWTKNFDADSISSAFASSNGKYINTSRKDVEIRKGAEQAYEKFIQAKGYQPYLEQEQRLGFGNYFDEGNKLIPFTDPRSSGYEQAKYVGLSDYRKETKADADKKADPIYLAKLDFEYKLGLAKAAAQTPPPIALSKDTSFYYNNTVEGKNVVFQYNSQKARIAQTLGAKDPSQYDKYIDMVRNNPTKYPKTFQAITTLDRELNSSMRAGAEYFRQKGFDQKQIDKVEAVFDQKGLNTVLSAKPGYIDFGSEKVKGKDNKMYDVQYFSKGANKGEKVTLTSLIGTNLNIPGYRNTKIKDIEVVDGTAGFMPAASTDGQSGVSTTVLITPEIGEPFYKEYYIPNDPLNMGF